MDSQRLKEIEQHKKLHNPEFQDAEELAAAAKEMTVKLLNFITGCGTTESCYRAKEEDIEVEYITETDWLTDVEVQTPMLSFWGYSISIYSARKEFKTIGGVKFSPKRVFEVGMTEVFSQYPYAPDDYEYVMIEECHSLYAAVGKVFELSMKNVIALFCERFEYYTEDEEPV
jgi:hypothetical protein